MWREAVLRLSTVSFLHLPSTEPCFSPSQLWVSQDLGVNWQLLDTDVVPSRYYWRVLGGDLDPATAVYYEKAVNGEAGLEELCRTRNVI